MADYTDKTLRELRELAKDQDLPTSGSKSDLVERLEAAETVVEEEAVDVVSDVTAEEEETPELEDAPEAEAPEESIPTEVSGTGFYEQVFRTYPNPLTDDNHLEFRRKTYTSAVDTGLIPIGGPLSAWRVRSEGGHHTYRINVR